MVNTYYTFELYKILYPFDNADIELTESQIDDIYNDVVLYYIEESLDDFDANEIDDLFETFSITDEELNEIKNPFRKKKAPKPIYKTEADVDAAQKKRQALKNRLKKMKQAKKQGLRREAKIRAIKGKGNLKDNIINNVYNKKGKMKGGVKVAAAAGLALLGKKLLDMRKKKKELKAKKAEAKNDSPNKVSNYERQIKSIETKERELQKKIEYEQDKQKD